MWSCLQCVGLKKSSVPSRSKSESYTTFSCDFTRRLERGGKSCRADCAHVLCTDDDAIIVLFAVGDCGRIFNVANVNKLFLGLYFCQTPLAQKSVKASATYLKVSHRRSSDEYAKRPSSVLPQSQPALNKYIQAALLEARITSALEGAQERQEKESVADTLSYFNKLIKKDGLKNMGKKGANNPLLGGRAGRRAVSPNPSSGQGTTAPPPRMASPKARPPLRKMHSSSEGSSGNTGVSSAKNKVHNPVDRRSKSFIVRSAILESVTTYRKSVQNYMIPPGLINLASYSQLDPNSIFASQQRYSSVQCC